MSEIEPTAPEPTAPEPLLRVERVTHRVGAAGSAMVLHEVDVTVAAAECVALAGRSGSGKTTLCHLVAGFGRPTSGAVLVAGTPADEIDDWAVVSLLPQRLALAEELTVAENVMLPLLLRVARRGSAGDRSAAAAAVTARGEQLLEILGLAALAGRLAGQTSLGEQQRAALARALVAFPRLAVLDEPTGHQDDGHVDRVLAAIALAREHGTAVLVATHDERVLRAADRIVSMREGRLATE